MVRAAASKQTAPPEDRDTLAGGGGLAAGDVAPAPRRLLSREERHASILAAAATAFARAGFAATSMEDVATEAGVTKLIVYRHFESKEDLYRAVLSAASLRMKTEFLRRLGEPEAERSGFASRSILAVARENPDGFRLLTLHATREPQFAAELDEYRHRGVAVADELIADMIPDPVTKAWATRVIVDYLIEGVHAWLDVGDPTRDEEFIANATEGLRGMLLAWVDPQQLPAKVRRAMDDLHAARD